MAKAKKTFLGHTIKHYPTPSPSMDKIAYCFIVGVVIEVLLISISKFYSRGKSFGFVYTMVLILAVAAAVGFVYFGILAVRGGSAKQKRRLILAAAFLGAALSFVIMRVWWINGIYVLYALWGGATLLLILNQIYHREFVFLSGLTGLAGTGAFANYKMMNYGTISSSTVTVSAVLLVAAVAVALATYYAGKKGGTLWLFGKSLKVYVIPSSSVLLYVTCLVVVLCVIASLIIGAAFCYYCFFVALAWLLISAAYYTIRLM